MNKLNNLEVFDEQELLYQRGIELFTTACNCALVERGRFVIALTGGRSAARFYQRLASTKSKIDWSRVVFFWGDERCVPPDDEQSNYRLTHETLLEPLNIKAAQIHRIEGERDDRDAAALDYQRNIAKTLGSDAVGMPPAFDLVLLSMGDDGHMASLFPGTRALDETSRWVVPNFVPKLESWRITLTLPIINQARNVVFFAVGMPKAEALQAVAQGKYQPTQFPSQAVRPHEGQLHWLVDVAAASQLKK